MPRLGHVLRLAGGLIYSTVFFGAPLFLGAWTLDWPRAWIFLGVVFVLTVIAMAGVFATRPELLRERYGSRRELEGYEDYMRRVRWRLLPYVW